MASIGEEGVLCLLSDSTGAERPGYTPSEAVVARDITEAFLAASGRIIVACFASNINRIQHVFNAAAASRRKVAVVGKSLQRVYETALNLGYLKVEEELIIPSMKLTSMTTVKSSCYRQVIKGSQLQPFKKWQNRLISR